MSVRWNGERHYVGTGNAPALQKDDDGRWRMVHVCCSCWRVHAVTFEVVDGELRMRWENAEPRDVKGIHLQMRLNGRPRECKP